MTSIFFLKKNMSLLSINLTLENINFGVLKSVKNVSNLSIINDNLQLSDMHGIELSAHFTL